MKTERRMKKGKKNGLIAVAATLAVVVFFATPQQTLAGPVTVPAPKETDSIHLGVKDPPGRALLKGWYCSKTDKVRNDVKELYVHVWEGTDLTIEEGIERAVNWEFKVLKKGWPFKLAGLQKSPVKNGLDAPPGGTKVYKFKFCYTKAELQTIHDKLQAWVDLVSMGKEIEREGLDREIGLFGWGKEY